jgi:hypothetical protein
MATAANAPRRFINPVFLGGALIFPPERPAWSDADITEVAKDLTEQFARRDERSPMFAAQTWEYVMDEVVASVK